MRIQEPYTSERVVLRHQGRDRTFVVVTPLELPEQPPALLYFHGSLQNGNVARNFTGRIFDDMVARTGAVLVYPDGVDRHFNDTRLRLLEKTRELDIDDVGFTRAIVDWLADNRGVDTSRIHACGYSNGGQMVMRLLHDAPGLLAGAATFAATMPAADNRVEGLGTVSVPTPFLAMHGTADRIVKYDGGVAGLDAAHSRGVLVSALESARYFATANGLGDPDHETVHGPEGVTVDSWSREGLPTVELWSIDGMGHVVPTPKQLPASIGPGTDSVVASDVLARFFGWA
ncbi:alpha/beta hydrolase family esterase [Corynebacterium comes]|uniref:Alpha/beta hydrolase family protein n=1 Tax=Corynebacterium comes TaxID=2675218 RepID=A0A6B8W3M3_9CORY|nr:dienelactone hydrolase family protein [Corynebacterium comes]QGU05526.1 Alpha/beta hydrolase family protein [Corynebacterium comes]